MRHALLAFSLLLTPVALLGCQSTPSAESLSAMSPADLFSGYTGNLNDLGGLLGGVNDEFSAATSLPKAKDLVTGLSAYAEKINALPPGQFDSLMQQFGPQIDPAMQAVDGQIARLASNPSYGSTITNVLQSIPRLN